MAVVQITCHLLKTGDKNMNKPFVAILMGSDSDLPTVETAFVILKKFSIPYEVKVTSAHRTPRATAEFVEDADRRGCAVFICAAGMAAHLAGAVAAMTLRPVIGLPIDTCLGGMDAMLSTVQMPAGIPVATVAIGKAGAKNAAYLATQILAVNDGALYLKLIREREEGARSVLAKDAVVQEKIANRT